MLKGAVSDGAHDLGLEHKVAEARAVQAHVLVLAALCRAARRAALGGARALVHLLSVLIVQQRLLGLLMVCVWVVGVGSGGWGGRGVGRQAAECAPGQEGGEKEDNKK